MEEGKPNINNTFIKAVDNTLPDNFIAVAIAVNPGGRGYHSGLVIGVDGEYKLFHFTGTDVELKEFPIEEYYSWKELEVIDKNESLAFLAHCEMIEEIAQPKFGYIFDGSYYINNEYITNTELGEKTTCVGFCINTITGFLVTKQQYFELEDWDADEQANIYLDEYLQNNQHVNREEIKSYFKRIKPSEYTASAYITDLPIRKQNVDLIIQDVEREIQRQTNISLN